MAAMVGAITALGRVMSSEKPIYLFTKMGIHQSTT